MLRVTAARCESDHRVRAEFSDGVCGVVDLEEDLWGPVFQPLTDRELFKRFTVSGVFHTIVWENGADIVPERLHAKLTGEPLERSGPRLRESGG